MSSIRGRIGKSLYAWLGPPSVDYYTEKLLESGECQVALDIGCGVSSPLTRHRPQVRTIGLDAHTVDVARDNNVHDFYIVADIITLSEEEILDRVEDVAGTRQIDLITHYGVIEHLPKSDGWMLLNKCEKLTSKYILLETPNGFVRQGPEFGNPYQRHLSGWYPNDFRGLGYDVYGTSGTKYVRGYMGEPRLNVPGLALFDLVVLSRLLAIKHFPQHAFNIVAFKDRRGVPARYNTQDDPNRR